jgi:alkanesulfonate monooxygenase SsuD/methylene tetrahydromethanopterin reductase-like flavin-dependent oxidoreductase (luciferase family)
MRFAIKTRPEHQTWEDLRAVWVAADEIPLFESAWNWDHFYPLTGDLTGPCFEAWTMLAAMAQATRRIRLGSQVTGMIYRHPAVLANMAATVDIISGGRLEIGLGAGWNQKECDAYGIELPPVRERFDRGKQRTLRTVARWAQQWNAIVADPRDWLELKEVLAGHCATAGRDVNEITCSVNVRIDPAAGLDPVLAAVAGYRDAGVDLVILNLPQHAEPGSLQPLAEALAGLT